MNISLPSHTVELLELLTKHAVLLQTVIYPIPVQKKVCHQEITDTQIKYFKIVLPDQIKQTESYP